VTEPNDRRGLARQDFLRLLGLGAGSYALGDYAFAGSVESVSQLHNAPVQHSYILDAARTEVQLGRQRASTFAYNGMLPGPELRVKHGDHMRMLVHNNLPTSTSVHWHGLPIPFHMDGVPGVTQAPIGPGTSFLYHFRAPVPGTYWYHSHSGIQNDKGLYGPLIIEPKRETLSYDREYTLMIDDWIDGIRHWSGNESEFLYTCTIQPQGRTENAPRLVGTPPAQPQRYPLFLINGKPGTAPEIIDLKRGDVVRLRLINASAATTVRAPRSSSPRTNAPPMPPAAPVTTVTLPSGSIVAAYGPAWSSANTASATRRWSSRFSCRSVRTSMIVVSSSRRERVISSRNAAELCGRL